MEEAIVPREHQTTVNPGQLTLQSTQIQMPHTGFELTLPQC